MARSQPMDHESADRISAAADRDPHSPTATSWLRRPGARGRQQERCRGSVRLRRRVGGSARGARSSALGAARAPGAAALHVAALGLPLRGLRAAPVDRVGHRVGCAAVQVLGDALVGVAGEGGSGVAELFGEDLDVDAGVEGDGGGAVA